MPFSYRGEIKELNERTRQEASGSFVQLSDGFTHYELSNPSLHPDGEVSEVVLVHGFSVPYFIYDPTFRFLARSGFCVLRYDLFGRGFSDRPETRYDIDLFVRQLSDLLTALNFTRPVSLVGLSMGGPIIAAFTARFPERVKKLVFIDPSGAKPVMPAFALKLLTLPFVGETILNQIGKGGLAENILSDFFDPIHVKHFQSRYLVQVEYTGFKRAILSTLRNGMIGSFLGDYQRIGKMDKPALLFWGRQDRTVPFQHSAILRAAMPNAQFHAFDHSGHIPHYEEPEEVNPILLEFLKR